jgi:predicted nuclease of predicted toxin-antitoxin system
MRVLLDENLPRRLAQAFSEDVDVRTVGQCGWKGARNGDLLRLAETEFDVFITTD